MTAVTSPPRTTDSRVLVTATFAIAAIVFGAGFAISDAALRQIGLVGILFFGVGAVPAQLMPRARLSARLGVSVLFGFTIICGLGALMAYISGAWHPVLVGVELFFIAVAVHCASTLAAVRDGSLARTLARIRRLPAAFDVTPSILLTVIGTALWAISAVLTGHLDAVSGGGILQQMSPLWFLGLAVLAAAVATADREHEHELALAII